MRKKLLLITIGAIALLVAGLTMAGLSSGGGEDEAVNIATMSQGTVSYGAGAALAQALLEKGDVAVRVQPNAGSSALVPLVNGHEMDLGIAGVLEIEEAANAENIFVGRPQENLRAAMILFPLEVGIWVRRDSDIKTIADLKGKRISAGFNAQKSVDKILESVLANGGLTRADVVQVMVPNIIRGAEDFIAGRNDAFFLAVGAAKVLEADASVGVRLLPMDPSPQAVARMHAVFKYAYLTNEVETPRTTGIFGTVPVTTYDMILVTNDQVDGERLRHMLTVFSENKPLMAAVHPAFRRFEVDKMLKDTPIPYHPAALEWYREHGIDKAS